MADKTKIPLPSQGTSGKNVVNKVYTLKTIKENLPVNKPISRRSKSYSDLNRYRPFKEFKSNLTNSRAPTTFPSKRPDMAGINVKKAIPSASTAASLKRPLGECVQQKDANVPAKRFVRRSKSFCDLKTTLYRPLNNYGLNSATTRPLDVASKNKCIDAKNTVACRQSLKRSSDDKGNDAKAKVVKVSKPAPYDYKARFNLLLEKHKSAQRSFNEAKENLRAITVKYEETAVENEKVKSSLTNLESKNKALETECQKFECRVSSQNEYIDFLKNDITKYENKLKVLEADLNITREKCNALDEDGKKMTKAFEDKSLKYDENLNLIKHLEAELLQSQCLNEKYCEDLQINEELRRKLHNQIQDMKGNIRVFCRIRPQKLDEQDRTLCSLSYLDENTLEIKKSKESISCLSGRQVDLKAEFSFDYIFPPHVCQEEVFSELSQLVQSALDGYNICVFAYGQTGSGKTFTMQGESNTRDLGMIPRTVNYIFENISKLKQVGWEYTVQASFIEIYNETVRDLLEPYAKCSYEIRHNEGKGTSITNLTTETIATVEDLNHLIYVAQQNRAVAATNFNEHSSRSHAITKVTLEGQNKFSNLLYSGSLNLVDLAGSESAKTSDRLIETKNINKSLSALGNVMLALHNKENHVPYRNSKLTYLLQSSLGGNSKTLMFVNISPFEDCYCETINSLRFASKVKEVKLGVKKNKTHVTTN